MEYIIRPPEKGDGKGIAEICRMPGVFETAVSLPSLREREGERLAENLPGNVHAFVAVARDAGGAEQVIGYGKLLIPENPRIRHKARLNLMVRAGWQGQGVGQSLMEALLDLADNWLMLVRVELEVLADNEKAVGLYRKLGFVEEARKRKNYAHRGACADSLVMARLRGD